MFTFQFCCQSRNKILLVFALYPAMMVDNDYIVIRHDLYSYILYILLLFALYQAMMVDNDYID